MPLINIIISIFNGMNLIMTSLVILHYLTLHHLFRDTLCILFTILLILNFNGCFSLPQTKTITDKVNS